MRRLRGAAVAAGLVAAGACAHIEPPSGGPEDREPPVLLVARPDSLAVVPNWRGPVVLVFNERLSERGLEQAVTVSPLTSPVRVDHRGDELQVELRGGWRPGTVYHVTVSPEIQDLFQNRRTEPLRLVFSTGAEIPETAAMGEVVDALTGSPEADVRVEAIRAADSLVYAVRTDSAGLYRITHVPQGEYLLRAYGDLNRNRALDAFEARDSAAVTLAAGDTLRRRFGILMPDSTPPQIASAQVRGDTVSVRFDDHLDPAQELAPARVQVLDAEGTAVPVAAVALGPPQGAGRAGGRPRGARPDTAVADTAAAAPVLPSQTLLIVLAPEAGLQPGAEYRVTVRGIRNVVGLEADAEATFTAPAPPADPPGAPGIAAARGAAQSARSTLELNREIHG